LNQNEIKIHTADPSAIGLFGLAIVTLVASSQKMGWTTGTAYIIPWAIFLGAFAQLYASVNDAKKGNVFGATAFGGYAFFWFSMAMSMLITNGVFGEAMAANADAKQLGDVFVGYLIFSIYMTVAATTTNKALFVIFCLIDLLFLGLSLNAVGGIHWGHTLAAYAELSIALVSFYASAANILNHSFKKVVLPIGKPIVKV
jgi:hypothetical protein